MTVKEMAAKLSLTLLCGGQSAQNTCSSCYIGDLLSWVMAKAQAGDVWLTVMGNINSIAVASLTDVACIVLTENAALDEDAKSKADEQDICVLQTDKNSYTLALEINALLNG